MKSHEVNLFFNLIFKKKCARSNRQNVKGMICKSDTNNSYKNQD